MISRPDTGEDGGRTIVIALGGNALLAPGERGDIHQQFARTRVSLEPIVELAREGWKIAVVHGNGPQIGDELVRNERARAQLPPLPLGVLVAGTAGWIGYMIQQSLQNALERAQVGRGVVTVITQTLVALDEPSARVPSKPIGRVMPEQTARAVQDELGWAVAPAEGGWRRLVPSPHPISIPEWKAVKHLLDAGTIVIAAGGGGPPVFRDPVLRLEGVDAVVDKDRAAQVLAGELNAEALLILTNVDGVFSAYGTPAQQLLERLSADEAERLLEAGEFGQGSMGPKVEAAIAFVRAGGRRAHIARLDRGLAAVAGESGTTITLEP